MSHWKPALALALWLAPACAVDLRVTDDTRISCNTNADCPDGRTCSSALKLCVRGTDQEPPVVTLERLDPPRVGSGLPVELVISVDETLGRAPTAVLGTPRRPELALTNQMGLQYTFSLTASDQDPAGAWPILVGVIDETGNSAPDVGVATLILDFEDPGLIGASLELVPDAGNPLPQVFAARDGTSIELTITTTERLTTPPTVWLDCNLRLDLPLTMSSDDLRFSYRRVLGSMDTVADGTCPVLADLIDDAGNRVDATDVSGLSVAIDRTAPTANAIDATRLLHLRLPWGAATLGRGPGQFLALATLGLDDDPLTPLPLDVFGEANETLLEARIYSDPATAFRVGTSRTNGQDWDAVTLSTRDNPELWVTVVDRAGNTSPAVQVPNGRWVASLDGKVPNSFVENPHRLTEHRHLVGELGSSNQLPAPAQSPPTRELGGGDSLFDQALTSAATWHRLRRGELMPDRIHHGLVYDAARGQPVMFGGANQPSLPFREYDETFIFNGKAWERVPVTGPPGRWGHGMAYDPIRERTVVFGGRGLACEEGAGPWCGDTWEWDGVQWTEHAVMGPDPRGFHSMAADGRGGVWLFGGETAAGEVGDLWRWDGSQWTDVSISAGAGPSPRVRAGVVHEPGTNRMWLFGGVDNSSACVRPPYCADLWRLDGSPASWTLVTSDPDPATAPLSPDWSLASDSIGDVSYTSIGGAPPRVIVWAWESGHGTAAPWVWDNGWTNLCDADSELCNVSAGFTSYRIERLGPAGGAIATGGCGAPLFLCNTGGASDKTILLENDRWRELRWNFPNRTGGYPAVVYDSQNELSVIIGGLEGAAESMEVTTWDGRSFRGIGGLAPYDAAAAAYDPITQKIVVFSGLDMFGQGSNDTWTAGSGSFAQVMPMVEPTNRSLAAGAFDPTRGQPVFFGGQPLNDETWAWDDTNTTWEPIAATAPAPRRGAALATDFANNRIVLFGGNDISGPPYFADTWAFANDAWTPIVSSTNPGDRELPAMAYDEPLGQVVLFGRSEAGDSAVVWTLAPGGWQALDVDPTGDGIPLPAFSGSRLVTAPGGRVLYVDSNAGEYWHLRTVGVAARVFSADLGAASIASNFSFSSWTLRWNVGGSGGAQMHLWNGTLWETIDSTAAPAGAPAALEIDNSVTAAVDLAVVGIRPSLHVAATAIDHLARPSQLMTDAPILFVDYTAP